MESVRVEGDRMRCVHVGGRIGGRERERENGEEREVNITWRKTN